VTDEVTAKGADEVAAGERGVSQREDFVSFFGQLVGKAAAEIAFADSVWAVKQSAAGRNYYVKRPRPFKALERLRSHQTFHNDAHSIRTKNNVKPVRNRAVLERVIVGVMTISTDIDKLYDKDLSDPAWALIAPMLPAARPGGRPRKINLRAFLNAIFYLSTANRLPMAFASPRVSRVEHGLSLLPGLEERWYLDFYPALNVSTSSTASRPDRLSVGRHYGWPVGENNRTRRHSRIRCAQACQRPQAPHSGDTFGLMITCRVEPADISDRKAAALLLGGLRPLFPNIRTVIADAGHQSAERAHHLLRQDGWKLQIVKRRQRAFKSSRSRASRGLWSAASRGLDAIGD
jgi:putative transposase